MSAPAPVPPAHGLVAVDDDHFHDQCGLFGIMGHPEAAHLAYLGLYALQHRGQESAGIVASDGDQLRLEKGMGLVDDVFDRGAARRSCPATGPIGHVRYSTAGDTVADNAQPYPHRVPPRPDRGGPQRQPGQRARILRQELEAAGSIFQSTSDTEVILHLYARSHRERLEDADRGEPVEGAWAPSRSLFLTPEALVAARDPWGFRPLVIGRLDGATIVASETCALDLIDAEYVRDVEPGEIVVVDGVRPALLQARSRPSRPAHCVFEHVYFARPDSLVFGRNVLESRLPLGRQLAREAPADADVVVPVPDSGMGAALGYAQESGLPFEWGLIRNHYVGRTFIEPRQSDPLASASRSSSTRCASVLEGQRVVLIDDSIVRGTTSRKIVRMVREAGAREVHVRISCPPTTGPCYYGIDTPLSSELIAANHTRRGDPALHRGRQPRLPLATRGCCRRWTTPRAGATAPPASPGATRSPCRCPASRSFACSRRRAAESAPPNAALPGRRPRHPGPAPRRRRPRRVGVLRGPDRGPPRLGGRSPDLRRSRLRARA